MLIVTIRCININFHVKIAIINEIEVKSGGSGKVFIY